MLARWNQRLPVVVLGRSTGNATDAVRLDDHGGMRVLVEHLIELGHRDIWLIEATGQRSGAERGERATARRWPPRGSPATRGCFPATSPTAAASRWPSGC